MTAATLYIPKKIIVGFQQRSDTFTGKLAYVIYKDHTGKLRKEASWNSWRDHKIDTLEIDNVPMPNFTLNKGVQRSREWFGSGRSMIRIWDPRDFEFEITVDNLLNVLMHADVSKRDITEPCVYAWQGTNLVLIPTNSIEYEESVKHTDKQSNKVSSRELVPGRVYSIKANASTEVIYLGRHQRYMFEHENTDHYEVAKIAQSPKKKSHVFMDIKTKEIFVKEPSAYVAGELSDQIHADYASLLDFYFETAESQPITGVSLTKLADIDHIQDGDLYKYSRSDSCWFALSDTDFVQLALKTQDRYYHNDQKIEVGSVLKFARFDPANSKISFSWEKWSHSGYGYYRGNSQYVLVSQAEIPGLSKTDLNVVALGELVKAASATLPPEDKRCGADYYTSLRRSAKETMKAVSKLGAASFLSFRLADGKLAHDHLI